MSVDYGSRISDLSLDFLISDHITSLVDSSKTLDKLLKLKEKEFDQKNTSIEKILYDKRLHENIYT
jgi:hypothetical protein